MYKLFIYAILCSIGYNVSQEYEKVLNSLFLNDSYNEDYLELEEMQYRDAILHTLFIMNNSQINQDEFGKCLMEVLKPIYEQSDISDFVNKMQELWKRLPSTIAREEKPFYNFIYVDEEMVSTVESYCRYLYESSLNYYEQEGTLQI